MLSRKCCKDEKLHVKYRLGLWKKKPKKIQSFPRFDKFDCFFFSVSIVKSRFHSNSVLLTYRLCI